MLEVSEGALDPAPYSTHGTAGIAHVVPLFIAALTFAKIGLELEDGVQAQCRVRVGGVLGRGLCSVDVDGLVGSTPNDED